MVPGSGIIRKHLRLPAAVIDFFSGFIMFENPLSELENPAMQPRIEIIAKKKLVGYHLSMSLADNRTYELWSRFMPRRKEIVNVVSEDLISMQVYEEAFSPHAGFQKWAVAEVTDFENVPEGMDTFVLPAGMYAVFFYKGTPAGFGKTFEFIFRTWLPDSGYELDERPHFEVLGPRYKNNDPESEEEIWLPVKPQNNI
jgi:AraC family transcriptional regulator